VGLEAQAKAKDAAEAHFPKFPCLKSHKLSTTQKRTKESFWPKITSLPMMGLRPKTATNISFSSGLRAKAGAKAKVKAKSKR